MNDARQFNPSLIAELFSVGRATVSRWMNRGNLKYDKLPSGHKRCTLAHLQQFAQDTDNQYFQTRLNEYIEALNAKESTPPPGQQA